MRTISMFLSSSCIVEYEPGSVKIRFAVAPFCVSITKQQWPNFLIFIRPLYQIDKSVINSIVEKILNMITVNLQFNTYQRFTISVQEEDKIYSQLLDILWSDVQLFENSLEKKDITISFSDARIMQRNIVYLVKIDTYERR